MTVAAAIQLALVILPLLPKLEAAAVDIVHDLIDFISGNGPAPLTEDLTLLQSAVIAVQQSDAAIEKLADQPPTHS
jgi:hypothetical protein